jgi:hypothetical protein
MILNDIFQVPRSRKAPSTGKLRRFVGFNEQPVELSPLSYANTIILPSASRHWQLGDIARPPASLVHREHLCGVRVGLRVTCIDVSEGLAGRILHDVATGDAFSGPRRLRSGGPSLFLFIRSVTQPCHFCLGGNSLSHHWSPQTDPKKPRKGVRPPSPTGASSFYDSGGKKLRFGVCPKP